MVQPLRPWLKVAAILDDISYQCLKYECNLILLDINTWEKTLIDEKPDFLFVESAWTGNNGQWRYKISNYKNMIQKELINLVAWCKDHGIPTAFWNKEDPVHFNYFIGSAKLFDYIFTTDSASISDYKKITGHDRVYLLPFAAQIKIHNPIDRDKLRKGQVAFAGSYYNNEHDDRKKDIEIVLKPSLRYNPVIYDKFYNFTENNDYLFPEIYKPYIRGVLPYEEIVIEYKKYDIFLNVNTVKNSPTMFSRRVFELLACGTNIVSGYSYGMDILLPGLTWLCKTEEDTNKYLETLLISKELRDRMSVVGQRAVFDEHTYTHRMARILDAIGIKQKSIDIPGVSIITCTNKPYHFDNILANFERQVYPKKELIIVINNTEFNIDELSDKYRGFSNIQLVNAGIGFSLGRSFNYGVMLSSFEYIAKFDDDDYYAPEYLTDSVNAFKYTDAGVVGKNTAYVYLEASKTLAERFPNMENCYTKHVVGATMVIKREIFDRIHFLDITSGEDTQFLSDCTANNIKIYSTNRFNYVCLRHPDIEKHTWRISDEEFLTRCRIVGYTDDYISHCSV